MPSIHVEKDASAIRLVDRFDFAGDFGGLTDVL